MRLLPLVVLGVGVLAMAQRAEVFSDPNAAIVDSVHLSPSPDGGCLAQWCGSIASDAASMVVRACTAYIPLKAVGNLNKCQAIASAGAVRLQKELGLVPDGGSL